MLPPLLLLEPCVEVGVEGLLGERFKAEGSFRLHVQHKITIHRVRLKQRAESHLFFFKKGNAAPFSGRAMGVLAGLFPEVNLSDAILPPSEE